MNIPFTTIYCFWLLSEIILNRFMHSTKPDKQNADKNSLRIIWLAIILSIAFSVYISMNFYYPISVNPAIQYIGLSSILTGIFIRLMVIKSLGQFFTVDVTIRQNHELKKDGFYKYLRHPSYFASLISFIGFAFSLNNWISLLIVSSSILIVFIRRIKVEEAVLIQQFGQEYLEYKKISKCLIPFIY